MGFSLSKLIGGSVGEAADGVANAIDRFVETEEEKKAAAVIMMKVQQQPDKWQTEINKIEAGHRSIFISGWRPAIGWICVCALGWGWILAPILKFIFPEKEMPAIELGQAISLVMALLGMGALRSYEKQKGLTG